MSIIDLEKLDEYSTCALYSMQKRIKEILAEKDKEELIDTLKDNYKTYINKCYLDEKKEKYYRVIHVRGENEYRVTVFSFSKKPDLSFQLRYSLKGDETGLILGRIELCSFNVETIMISNLEHFTKISRGEFDIAFDEHCRLLKGLELKIDDDYEKKITE